MDTPPCPCGLNRDELLTLKKFKVKNVLSNQGKCQRNHKNNSRLVCGRNFEDHGQGIMLLYKFYTCAYIEKNVSK